MNASYILSADSSGSLPNSTVLGTSSGLTLETTGNVTTLGCAFGTTSGSICQGNDPRLSDARLPSSILGATCKSGATFSQAGEAVVFNGTELEPTPVYCKYLMGSEGSIPFAGQDAAAGIQSLEPGIPDWSLVVGKNGNPTYAPVSRWRRTTFDNVVDDTTFCLPTYAYTGEYPIPRDGLPVRFASKAPIVYNDTYGNYANCLAELSGIVSNYADSRGRVYLSLISDGGGSFHVNFYSDAARTVLFGHTAAFSAAGSVAFIPNNGCGLSGNTLITGTLTANSTAILQLFRYGVIVNAGPGVFTVYGPEVLNPEALWIGTPELIRPLDIVIQGSYAGVTTSQAIFDRTGIKTYCDFAAAHLAVIYQIHGTNDETTQPKIALVHNGSLTYPDASAQAVSVTRQPNTRGIDNLRCVEFGQSIELRVQKLGTGNARDLSLSALYVLE